MKSVSVSFLPLAVVLVLTVAAMKPVKAFNCLEAKLKLLSCLPFITSNADSPSTACCNALSYLKASTPTKPELRAACECLAARATFIPNIDLDRAMELPKLCNVDAGFTINKDFDCSMISL